MEKIFGMDMPFFDYDKEGFLFTEDDVKSALEWMIQKHEDRIEQILMVIEDVINHSEFEHSFSMEFMMIDREYEAIMILEEGLSDVI